MRMVERSAFIRGARARIVAMTKAELPFGLTTSKSCEGAVLRPRKNGGLVPSQRLRNRRRWCCPCGLDEADLVTSYLWRSSGRTSCLGSPAWSHTWQEHCHQSWANLRSSFITTDLCRHRSPSLSLVSD